VNVEDSIRNFSVNVEDPGVNLVSEFGSSCDESGFSEWSLSVNYGSC
jgi:hypothetical protein